MSNASEVQQGPRQRRLQRTVRKALHQPNLFYINRRSVSRAIAIGVGVGVLPIYGHMPMAAVLAIRYRANLIISVISVWVSNPFTLPFIVLAEYWLGALILGMEVDLVVLKYSGEQWRDLLTGIWKPLVVGSLVLSLITAAASHAIVSLIWRAEVSLRWRARNRRTSRSVHKDRA